MSGYIDVPGTVRFTSDAVKFVLPDGEREMDLTPLLGHGPSAVILKAMLGIGFQDFLDQISEKESPQEPPSAGDGILKQATAEYHRAVEDAQSALESAQEQFLAGLEKS